MATSESITIDVMENVVLDGAARDRLHNELNVLSGWAHGLYFLYSQVRHAEMFAGGRFAVEMGQREDSPPPAELDFGNLSCCFQWYAVTLCNFVELIGAIGWEIDSTRRPPRDYIKIVIPAVLEYRNKIGAHVGRARRNAANPAEQLLSLLPPSALVNGRYMAGSWSMQVKRRGSVSVGRLKPWSLTETHESLADRYRPFFTSIPPSQHQSASAVASASSPT